MTNYQEYPSSLLSARKSWASTFFLHPVCYLPFCDQTTTIVLILTHFSIVPFAAFVIFGTQRVRVGLNFYHAPMLTTFRRRTSPFGLDPAFPPWVIHMQMRWHDVGAFQKEPRPSTQRSNLPVLLSGRLPSTQALQTPTSPPSLINGYRRRQPSLMRCRPGFFSVVENLVSYFRRLRNADRRVLSPSLSGAY